MVNPSHTSLMANDRSYLAGIKKEVHKLAVQAGFTPKKINEVDILISELCSNLIKHANGGEILAGIVTDSRGTFLELISIDNGPGISDPERMLQDGISTTHTLGQGLGAIKRLSTDFDIYSKKGWGTIILSRVYDEKGKEKSARKSLLTVRSLVVAKPGELTSGDGWYGFVARDGTFRLLAADGLGHGYEAGLAVTEAITAFREIESASPMDILRQLNTAIKKTRGMVATVVIVDLLHKTWKFCGIGNISTRFTGVHLARSYLSYNGIVGHNIPNTLNDQIYSQDDYQQIILCSDGIRSRWEHARLPDITKQDLIVQAAAIYKDFARKTDDMSIIIGKLQL